MANESSFYGDITFYHKGLEDTPENREKFKKIIEEFCEIYPGYYGNIELGSSDIEIDEDFDYVHSEPLSFTSIGRWSYENSFKWILSFSQKDIEDASAKMPITFDNINDYIGFGVIVEGRDFEPGCEYLADFNGQIEITGIEEVNNEVKTLSTIIKSEETVLEYTAENLNNHEDSFDYFDFKTQYGLEMLFEYIQENDHNTWSLIEKYAPNLVDVLENANDDKLTKVFEIMIEVFKEANITGTYYVEDFQLEEFRNNRILYSWISDKDFEIVFSDINNKVKGIIG
nr:MAG TPA: hypothetical protein [Bacteriophage sp.]